MYVHAPVVSFPLGNFCCCILLASRQILYRNLLWWFIFSHSSYWSWYVSLMEVMYKLMYNSTAECMLSGIIYSHANMAACISSSFLSSGKAETSHHAVHKFIKWSLPFRHVHQHAFCSAAKSHVLPRS